MIKIFEISYPGLRKGMRWIGVDPGSAGQSGLKKATNCVRYQNKLDKKHERRSD
jgi:hypothetical protein